MGGGTTVSGRLMPEHIQSVVRQHFPELRSCYEQARTQTSHLQGSISVRFVIKDDGLVDTVVIASDLPGDSIDDCVVKVFHAMRFDEPEGGIVTVMYPLRFCPPSATGAAGCGTAM